MAVRPVFIVGRGRFRVSRMKEKRTRLERGSEAMRDWEIEKIGIGTNGNMKMTWE